MANVDEAARSGSVSRRWWASAGLAVAPLGLIVLTFLGWRDRLPDPMPSHWGRAGQVTDTVSLSTLVAVVMVLASLAVVVALAGAAVPRLPHQTRRVLVGAGAAVSAFLAGLWVVTAWLSLDLTDPRQAAGPTWQLLVWLLAVAAMGVAAFLITPGRVPPPAAGVPPADLPRADLARLEPAGWHEPFRLPRAILVVPLVLLVAAVAMGVAAGSAWVGSPMLVLALLVTPLCFGRLVLDRAGLRASFGPWGWPVVRAPLAQIERAEPTHVAAPEWGGWGYRIHSGGARAVITRSGPAVRLTLSEGRRLVVSTAEPELVAGLINSLLDQGRGYGT